MYCVHGIPWWWRCSADPATGAQKAFYEEVIGRTFTPRSIPDQAMKDAGFSGNLTLMTRGSKFVKFQEIRIQELADKVPIGHIPRSMTIRVAGELTRALRPGEEATITGVLMPEPYTGMRAMQAGLIQNMYLHGTYIQKHKVRKGSGCSTGVVRV